MDRANTVSIQLRRWAWLLMVPWLSTAAVADGLPEAAHLIVVAEAEVEALPDRVVLSLQISETRQVAADAKSRVDQISQQVLDAAAKQGIKKDRIEASQIRVYPDYDWQEGVRVLRGQRVERTVVLTLDDLSRYGALLDGLVKVGITELGGARFELSQRDALQAQALKMALAKAKQKAALLAGEFGRKVNGVYQVEELGGGPSPRPMAVQMMEAKVADEAPMIVGKQTVAASVRVVFLLD